MPSVFPGTAPFPIFVKKYYLNEQNRLRYVLNKKRRMEMFNTSPIREKLTTVALPP